MPSSLYSMKIKEQTRKLATGCSKHCFEVADIRQGDADVV
ncbi:F0F1 ATP synthase subunit A [Streptococcus pneumoniae GA41688]|nr:F0F1 ATP synthase subunit A [Streptococcus pneumoniae GA41688]